LFKEYEFASKESLRVALFRSYCKDVSESTWPSLVAMAVIHLISII